MKFRRLFAFALCAAGCASAQVAQSTGPFRWVLMDLNRLPSEDVAVIFRDDLENRFYATRKGLSVEDKSGDTRIFTRSSTQGGLGSDSLTSLAMDRYRDLWIGTDGGGISVYSNGSWRRYTRDTTKGGLPDDHVLALTIYREEKWVGTRNGFAVLRGGSWTTYSGDQIAGRLPNPAVTALAVDSSGDKWIGTIGGLVRLSGSVWTRFTTDNTGGGLPHNGITWVAVDPGNAVWVGTQAGLACRNSDGTWTSFAASAGLADLAAQRVASVTFAPGEAWVSFKGGAARFRDNAWTLFTRDNVPGLVTLYVNYVLPGPNGAASIATQKGVISRVPVPAKPE